MPYFPYRPSSEDLSSLPYKITFNNIPQGTKLGGIALELQFSTSLQLPGATETYVATAGHWEIPFSIQQGNFALFTGKMLCLNSLSKITGSTLTTNSSNSGLLFELFEIPFTNYITVIFYPPTTPYVARSCQLLGVS